MTADLVIDIDGFEGPIALLLSLAREQKVDLTRISVLALTEQYLAFIAEADRLRLELAADYLVMAAWLAYLKSRLLLPDPPPEEEPSGPELAAALQFRLMRLEAIQKAGAALMALPQLGRDTHGRGAPEGFGRPAPARLEASLADLMRAYAGILRDQDPPVLQIRAPEYYSVDDALQRLTQLLGGGTDWRRLQAFLPPQWQSDALAGALGRSALAATFVASLELAKAGQIELRQDQPFGPIYLRPIRPRS